jgi:hypothetical protein
VIVGDQPIRWRGDLEHFIARLDEQITLYRKEGRYRSEADREHALQVFARARDVLRERLPGAATSNP